MCVISYRVADFRGMPHLIAEPKVVLFDLDDTLVESYGARLIALREALSNAGITSPSAEQVLQAHDGKPSRPIVNKIGTDHGVKSDLFAEYLQTAYRTPPGVISLYPGIKSALEDFYARGMKLGVITSKIRSTQVAGAYVGASKNLAELGISGLFDVVVGYEDTTHHKPDPEPVLLALTTLSVAPQDAIFVGDTPADIEAGQAAGCRTCLATWGTSGEIAGSAGADLVAETPESLLSMILGAHTTHTLRRIGMNKQETLTEIDQEWRRLLDIAGEFSKEESLIPGAVGNWNFTESLIHVAAWDDELVKQLESYLNTGEKREYGDAEATDRLNAAQVDEKRGLALEKVWDHLDETHKTLLEFLTGLPETSFEPQTSTIRMITGETVDHYSEHRAVC